jgi:hypothetical protein
VRGRKGVVRIELRAHNCVRCRLDDGGVDSLFLARLMAKPLLTDDFAQAHVRSPRRWRLEPRRPRRATKRTKGTARALHDWLVLSCPSSFRRFVVQ